MAAKSKTELIALTEKEFGKLQKLIIDIDPSIAIRKRDDDTSIKDVIGHRAHWMGLFLGWYADGMAGKTVYFPAKGYKWNDLKRYNSNLRQNQAELDWPTALALLSANFERLIQFLQDHSEEELYNGAMQGANNAWTPGRWAEAAGASHFRSAAKYVRTSLKEVNQE